MLRSEAHSWWRHRELRSSGDLDEARRQERQTIRRDLGYLRKALNNPNAYVSCGGGGTILHLGLKTFSLYAPVERFPLASLAIRLGTPLIEPPLVCRRAFGSNVRLLFHLGSRLHRTSPLLHAA